MIGNAKLSYEACIEGTKIVAIYATSLGKFLDVKKYACVKYLTNIMSAIELELLEHLKGR